jgi:hypothetical protein
VDDIVGAAIRDSAFPGAQLAIVKDGLLVYDRAFGRQTYDPDSPPVANMMAWAAATIPPS